MANNQASVMVNKVKPHKDSWKVHVKLLHSWTQNTSYGGETLECVLADQTGGKIHASCKKTQMFRLRRSLPIGEWRFIENFKVSASGGKYRPTPLPYKITSTSDTVIGRSVFEDDDPCLDLVSYEDIGRQGSDANVLIDIIGEVFSLDGIQILQVQGQDRKKVHFRLRDTNGHDVRYCLWGKYAEQFEPFIEDNNVENLICLIRFAKNSFYQGDLQITNAFDASLVILNPTMKEAIEFREKLLQADLPLTIMGKKSASQVIKHQKTDWDNVQFRSIAEILVAIEVQSCKIICSIESVDKDWGWFYFGCCGCNKRVIRIRRNELAQNEKPLWYCDKCHSNVTKVEPKYKLHLNVKDDSGSCKLMMLDTIASTIIGSGAVELWDGSYDEANPEVIPILLEGLVGKSFSFGISITSGNLDSGSNTFFVSEVWTGDGLPKLETQSEPVSALDTNSSTLSSGEVLMLKPNSESSSEGFTTPTAKRKEEDAELKGITSTSKKMCTKPVKLEKTK
ncbi:hypothetical protein Bca52824_016605 [Brassica carinata]|uniref:Uncharacterized protein n=1 Tax=Brassica carinata TaxID=52824 RepID=A0A8X8B6P4_BRACI|nr:hypothetical protein Bca52824_016605 [Brassica carinata]